MKALRRRRWRYGAAAIAVVALGTGLGIAFGTSSQPPSGSQGVPVHGSQVPPSALADVAATPPGWVPLQEGVVQISVPANWQVFFGVPVRCGAYPGVVDLGARPTGRDLACVRTHNLAWVGGRAPGLPSGGKQAVVNGVAVTVAHDTHTHTHTVTLFERTASPTQAWRSVAVGARGPLATKVIGTFTHSPRSLFVPRFKTNNIVALRYTASVPRSWRRVTTGGLTFSAPRNWTVRRSAAGLVCPRGFPRTTVLTANEQVLSIAACPSPYATARYIAAQPGMVVTSFAKTPPNAGRQSAMPCFYRNGLRICFHTYWLGQAVPSTALGVMTFHVSVPGKQRTDVIELQLSGSGRTPLAVFDSLRPADS